MSDAPRRSGVTKLRTMGEFLTFVKPAQIDLVKRSPAGRLCHKCSKKLSIYNHDSECEACYHKMKQAEQRPARTLPHRKPTR